MNLKRLAFKLQTFYPLLQTYKASEVVQKLAELYGGDSA